MRRGEDWENVEFAASLRKSGNFHRKARLLPCYPPKLELGQSKYPE